jgi:subtilase family serine protease
MEAVPLQKGAEPRDFQKVPSDQLKPRVLPDFKVNKVFIAPYTPNPPAQFSPLNRDVKLGEKVYLICEMTNIGGNHKGLWSIGFFVDGQAAWNNRWGDLAAGKGLTGVGVYTAGQEGMHQYECVLDYLNEVAEKEEKSNNKMGLSFRVGK